MQPKSVNYVPLFEEHRAVTSRFERLPENIKLGMSAILDKNPDAIFCGTLGQYLIGECEEMPEEIEIILSDEFELPGEEHAQEHSEEHNLDYPPQPEERQEREPEHAAMSAQPEEGAEIVVLTINPNGEIETMGPEHDEAPEGEYDDDGNFKFEGMRMSTSVSKNIAANVLVFESKSAIQTMPVTMGCITVLVGQPGVIAEYSAKFAKVKDAKLKFDKAPKFDDKQKRVDGENNMQDAPQN